MTDKNAVRALASPPSMQPGLKQVETRALPSISRGAPVKDWNWGVAPSIGICADSQRL
jgi:hypothetical protein